MAALEGKPLMQHEEDLNDLEQVTWCGCGCFRVFGFKGWRRSPDGDGRGLLGEDGGGGERESWVVEKLRKVKEFSEVIAGPKWKTFIRKIGGYYGGKKQNNRFHYDQHSYDLNFNSGANSDDDANMPPSFSARFTAPRRQTDQHFNVASL